jgi:hypothetical protein
MRDWGLIGFVTVRNRGQTVCVDVYVFFAAV